VHPRPGRSGRGARRGARARGRPGRSRRDGRACGGDVHRPRRRCGAADIGYRLVA
jgi:hypothetical protein